MHRSLPYLSLVVAALTGCAGEVPVAPSQPDLPDLRSHAFHLFMDTRTGQVTVDPPGAVSTTAPADGPSFSLIGTDGVFPNASNLQCTAIPHESKVKRCTLDLTLFNDLSVTDLVTPTTFPRPPQGATGIIVFPWTATVADGAVGPAVPSLEWDSDPVDFFNDFSGCSSGGKSDCYRYESFSSPLYARTASETRQIGYDVPVDATTISAYILVAADLRDNPPVFQTLNGNNDLCGDVQKNSDETFRIFLGVGVLVTRAEPSSERRSFCTFPGTTDPTRFMVVKATLRLYSAEGRHGALNPVILEQVDYGDALDEPDYAAESIRQLGGLTATDSDWEEFSVTSMVRAGHDQGASRFQIRLRPRDPSTTSSLAWAGTQPLVVISTPKIVVELRLR